MALTLSKTMAVLKKARQDRGLTQSELAGKASLSLATIQNLEAGRANPEFATLEKLVEILGFEIRLVSKKLDLNGLIAHGMPLLSEGRTNLRPERMSLFRNLAEVGGQLDQLPSGRESEALQGLLLAIRDHYPSIWGEVDGRVKTWFSKRGPDKSFQLVKLRRMALSRLAEYL